MPSVSLRDPRDVLARQKYFSLRPKPLEQWLWQQGIPPSAERVFWLHWEAGQRQGDWCSSIPLRRVAALCCLDISTVTRAYQLLTRLGLVRRQDPGRDASNPFQQATAVTEVRVPQALLTELNRYPNRGPSERRDDASAPLSAPAIAAFKSAPPTDPVVVDKPADPFVGLSGRARMTAVRGLMSKFSATEMSRFQIAQRTHEATMQFDETTALTGSERGTLLQLLACMAIQPAAPVSVTPLAPQPAQANGPRRLTVFELARLRRDVQQVTGTLDAPEVVRQVTWSIEEGALRRFSWQHALHIALKKIREGAWTRPNRMPPNWAREFAATEQCRTA